MIIDSSNIETGKVIATDICIIGAGVAGITVAREFINKDVNVLLLESGGLEPNPELQTLNTGKNVGTPYYDLDRTRVRAFGGTSHRWIIDIDNEEQGVRLRGMDSIDFEKRDWVPYSGWPFSKTHLDPYYERAHEVCKIGPYSYDADHWKSSDTRTPLPFVNEKVKTTIFQFTRKNIFYEDYRRELDNAKNITTVLNATALKIEASENAKKVKTILTTTRNGKEFRVKATQFILATGALEIPRLLLLSNDVMKCGLGNQNDLVGRFFMEHPHLWSGVFYPSDPNLYKRAGLYDVHQQNGTPVMGKLTIDENVLREEQLLNFTTSIHPVSIPDPNSGVQSLKKIGAAVASGRKVDDFEGHLKNCIQNFDGIAAAVLRKVAGPHFDKYLDNSSQINAFKLNIMAEQVPDPESRVMLDNVKDQFGQQKIKLDWKLNSQDIRSIRKAQQIVDNELRRSGLGHLEIELKDDVPPPDIHGGWHNMGTTRMHESPENGVVDPNCRVHGILNLFIAGPSVYPTVGYANPVLTAVALSLRLADHLKKQIDN
ncbi:FAD-dependent oxidoreductase [Fodinibius saliphilus]|uniref:FAD-dependent oxidoreductase n=1 Tax=Fodinibius saliphilus TaxID=1920650 RepID=UPI001107F88D|nr:GMC family oxidoreductase [Fodinibius saliphilus]